MNKYQLTPTELFVLRVLLIVKEDNYSTLLKDYISLSVKENLKDTITSLQNKGIINKTFKIEGEFHPALIPFNKNVVKNIYKAAFEMGEELFREYPGWVNIKGVNYPLRNVAKKYNSPEDAFRAYGKAIRWNPETHAKIIELVKWAKNEGHINFSLSSFIINRAWLDLQDLKDGKVTNISYDYFKDI